MTDTAYPCAGCGRDLGHSPTSHAIEHDGQTLAGCSHACLQRAVIQLADNEPRWVHPCPVCGVTLTGDQGEQCAEHMPSPDELARKQRVVDAIGAFLAKPSKPTTFRRWRR